MPHFPHSTVTLAAATALFGSSACAAPPISYPDTLAVTAVTAAPVPPPPAPAPDGLTGTWTKTRAGDAITLHWSAVPGAVGYRSKGL